METITRNIRDLPSNDRSALERVVGHGLRESQQVIMKLVEIETPTANSPVGDMPECWHIYDGLSDQAIDEPDAAIRQRANLTPSSE